MKPGEDRIVSHTEEEWNARDPVLADGEIGINRNGGRLKYGDGVTPWSRLLYLDQNYATTTDVAQVSGDLSRVSADIAQVSADVAEVRQKAEKVDALAEQVADNKARLDDVRADVADIKKKLPPAASSSAVDLPA